MAQRSPRGQIRSAGRYVFVGAITVAPLWITWLIVEFLLGQLARVGRPWVQGVAQPLLTRNPQFAQWLLDDSLQTLIAAALVLTFLLLLGWATTHVIGRRLIGAVESLIGFIPLVHSIYQSTKKFLTVAGGAPEAERRVVLIDFPSPEMKAVGFVTRTLKDAENGEELAAVYVPTAPNPTSGYVEIVPVRNVTFTTWSFDQAMAFVITGGSTSPDSIHFTRPSAREPAALATGSGVASPSGS